MEIQTLEESQCNDSKICGAGALANVCQEVSRFQGIRVWSTLRIRGQSLPPVCECECERGIGGSAVDRYERPPITGGGGCRQENRVGAMIMIGGGYTAS